MTSRKSGQNHWQRNCSFHPAFTKKEGRISCMASTEQYPPVHRLTTTLDALSVFLDDPDCCSCEILEICLKHLQDDVRTCRFAYPKSLLRTLRRLVPFSAAHRHCESRRCAPAEILMSYLTPGEKLARGDEENPPVCVDA